MSPRSFDSRMGVPYCITTSVISVTKPFHELSYLNDKYYNTSLGIATSETITLAGNKTMLKVNTNL